MAPEAATLQGPRLPGLNPAQVPRQVAQPGARQGPGVPPAYGLPAKKEPAPAQGTYSRVSPPSSGFVDNVLIREGWTLWENYAGQPKSQTAKYEGGPQDGQTIKNAKGEDAVATRLNPAVYGGTLAMNVGYCQGWINGNCVRSDIGSQNLSSSDGIRRSS
jgi:hypothetical protein